MPTLTKFATSNAVIVGTAFTNPTNAYADDGNLATLTSAAKNQFPVGEHGWGFPGISVAEIPDGSTIDAVRCVGEMGLTVAVTGGEVGLNGVANGTADPGTEQTKSTAGLGVLTYTYVTIPSLANLRTAGYYEASVRYRRGNTTVSSTAQVDYLKLEIDYTPPAGGTSANAEVATSTGAAANDSALITANLGTGSGTSAAMNVAAALNATLGLGTSTGAALNATASTGGGGPTPGEPAFAYAGVATARSN